MSHWPHRAAEKRHPLTACQRMQTRACLPGRRAATGRNLIECNASPVHLARQGTSETHIRLSHPMHCPPNSQRAGWRQKHKTARAIFASREVQTTPIPHSALKSCCDGHAGCRTKSDVRGSPHSQQATRTEAVPSQARLEVPTEAGEVDLLMIDGDPAPESTEVPLRWEEVLGEEPSPELIHGNCGAPLCKLVENTAQRRRDVVVGQKLGVLCDEPHHGLHIRSDLVPVLQRPYRHQAWDWRMLGCHCPCCARCARGPDGRA